MLGAAGLFVGLFAYCRAEEGLGDSNLCPVSHSSGDWLLDTVYTILCIVGGQLSMQFYFTLRAGCFCPTR